MTVNDARIQLTEKRFKAPIRYLLIEAVVFVGVAASLVHIFS